MVLVHRRLTRVGADQVDRMGCALTGNVAFRLRYLLAIASLDVEVPLSVVLRLPKIKALQESVWVNSGV